MKSLLPRLLFSRLTLFFVLSSVRLHAQTTTLYSTTFPDGTLDGWTNPVPQRPAYFSPEAVGYAVYPNWMYGSSANLYSPPINLTGYTSNYSINLSFSLGDAISTHTALVIGVGGAPNPYVWIINTPNTFSVIGDTGRSIVLSGTSTYQYFSFDITTPIHDFINARGDASNFYIELYNMGRDNVWTAPYIGNISLTATSVAIPEPSTYAAIFGTVVLGFAAYKRRRSG